MKINEEKIMKLLASAGKHRELAVIPDGWQIKTMRRIRNMEPPNAKIFNLALFNRFVWRFAATACVLVILLSVYAFQYDFQTEYELARMLVSDPLGFDLVQSFGLL
ncbi:MAG: hypothetical protein AB7S75_07685 [Desulfococcaceae bacterium]